MKRNSKRQKCSIDSDEIGMIAACLSDNYLKILYDFCNGRNLFGYIGCLSEISDWSHEFYREYYDKMNEWEVFEESDDNIYNAVSWDDFLIEWGFNRFKKFLDEHGEPNIENIISQSSSNHIVMCFLICS